MYTHEEARSRKKKLEDDGINTHIASFLSKSRRRKRKKMEIEICIQIMRRRARKEMGVRSHAIERIKDSLSLQMLKLIKQYRVLLEISFNVFDPNVNSTNNHRLPMSLSSLCLCLSIRCVCVCAYKTFATQ